jgi:hypothetical protein
MSEPQWSIILSKKLDLKIGFQVPTGVHEKRIMIDVCTQPKLA